MYSSFDQSWRYSLAMSIRRREMQAESHGLSSPSDAADVVLADEEVLALPLPQIAVAFEPLLGRLDELGALLLDGLPRLGREQLARRDE